MQKEYYMNVVDISKQVGVLSYIGYDASFLMFQRTIRNVVSLRFCTNTSCSTVYPDQHAHYAHIKLHETRLHSQSFNNHVSELYLSHYKKIYFTARNMLLMKF